MTKKNDLEKEIPIKTSSRRDIRFLAFNLLYAVDRFDYSVSLDQVIQNFQDGFDLEIPHDSYAIEMVIGAMEMRKELDEEIKPMLKNWKLERLGCCTHLILRLALWELKQPNAIPSIVINEAIELAKAFAEKDAYKFVNGILDEICKKLKISDGDKEPESSKPGDSDEQGDKRKS